MEEMKAVRLHAYGGPENLVYEDAPRPDAGDELVVRVHAAGVNVLDWLLGEGGFEDFPDVPLPWIPGWDISGVVEVVGNGVSGFRQGDSSMEWFGCPNPETPTPSTRQSPPVRSWPSRPSWTTYKRRRCR